MAYNSRFIKNINSCDGTLVGEGVKFERIRRITGYLVGTLDRFNNAKRAEEKDRVKHDCNPENCHTRLKRVGEEELK